MEYTKSTAISCDGRRGLLHGDAPSGGRSAVPCRTGEKGEPPQAGTETARTIGRTATCRPLPVWNEMGPETGRPHHRASHLPQHSNTSGHLLCRRNQPAPMGHHHAGRTSGGRGAIHKRENKRQRDSQPDHHPRQDTNCASQGIIPPTNLVPPKGILRPSPGNRVRSFPGMVRIIRKPLPGPTFFIAAR